MIMARYIIVKYNLIVESNIVIKFFCPIIFNLKCERIEEILGQATKFFLNILIIKCDNLLLTFYSSTISIEGRENCLKILKHEIKSLNCWKLENYILYKVNAR